MWFYRQLLRVSWKIKITNVSILEELNVSKQLSIYISKRKLKYVGNTETPLMSSILQGKVEGPRKRGRPMTS